MTFPTENLTNQLFVTICFNTVSNCCNTSHGDITQDFGKLVPFRDWIMGFLLNLNYKQKTRSETAFLSTLLSGLSLHIIVSRIEQLINYYLNHHFKQSVTRSIAPPPLPPLFGKWLCKTS